MIVSVDHHDRILYFPIAGKSEIKLDFFLHLKSIPYETTKTQRQNILWIYKNRKQTVNFLTASILLNVYTVSYTEAMRL